METEVELCPRGTNRMPDDRPIITGAERDGHDPGQTNRFGPRDGAKLKKPEEELPIQRTPVPRRPLPGTRVQLGMPVNDQFTLETPRSTYPRPDRQLPKAGTWPVINWFMETSSMPTLGHDSPPPWTGTQPVTVRFVETLTMPTPERGSLPPQAGIQPGND